MSNETINNPPADREEFYEQVKAEFQKPRLVGKTEGQKEYLYTINTSVITLCTGVAGTGKTYIAVVRAIEMFKENQFKKILVARPAVTCGRDLGMLPGDLNEKTAPFMRPILDILHDYFEPRELQTYLEDEIIELCPLTYMRGRTLNNTIMILDEAQNATWEELVMFMTRIGENSKMIISGDEDQSDTLGRAYAQAVAKWLRPPYVDAVNVVELGEEDIVRNGLIRKIIQKMGNYEEHFKYSKR